MLQAACGHGNGGGRGGLGGADGGCACDDGKGGPPAPNKTSEASHYYIGRDPQFLPYFGPCCPLNGSCDSCWDPASQIEIGADFSTPKAGMCRPGQSLGGDPRQGGCTWRPSPVVDVLYGGRDLLPRGWQLAPGAGSHYPRPGDNTTGTTLHNKGVFERAWAAHDAQLGPRCCGC